MSTYTRAAYPGVVVGVKASVVNVVKTDGSWVLSPSAATAGPSSMQICAVVADGFSGRYPFSYTESFDSVVLLANGVDPVLRWSAQTGSVEFAGCPAPLTAPTVVLAGSVADALNPVYAAVRFVDVNGNYSDLSPISDAVYGYNPNTGATYSSVPKPSGNYSGKVIARQILRTTPGQAVVFYVDLETGDLTSTSFTSTHSDAVVQTNLAVPLLDTNGGILANINGFPPSHKTTIAIQLGRAFMAGEVAYREGSIIVTAGSTTVTGVGTHWPSTFVGRHLFITIPQSEYEISAVDTTAQTLTLTEPYGGASSEFLRYGIRAPSSEWRLVYYTPAGLPESWPATYAIAVQDDGDEITGLMVMSSYLYILERRHIYRFTFQDDPATDGAVFRSSSRGCLNNRLWVQVEDTAYMLDEMGIHAFSNGGSQPISEPIQDLFRDNTLSPLKVNWDADQTLWHASYSEVHATVRFFVAMTGNPLPRHALCYNYRLSRWWIEEYQAPVSCSCRTQIGTVRTLAGMDHRTISAFDASYYDGTRAILGTFSGTCTASYPCDLTDATATFEDEVIGLFVTMTTGDAKGHVRRIVDVVDSGTTLVLKTPWTRVPDVGDSYMIAGVPWLWQAGWFRIMEDVQAQNRRDVEVIYQPNSEGIANLQLFYNHSQNARVWTTSRTGTATVIAGQSQIEIDLTNPVGRGIFRMEGHREYFLDGDAYVSPMLDGLQHGDPVRIYRVSLNGVMSES